MDIWKHINFKRATRAHREHAAHWVLDHPEALPDLISALLCGNQKDPLGDDPLSVKAAYILEMIAIKDIKFISAELPNLASHLPQFNSNSIQRALLHMMSLWLSPEASIYALDQSIIDRLTEYCFDRLIAEPEAAIAVQAHAMSCLFLLSRVNPWIKEPLTEILIKNMPGQSPGYRARARQILDHLNQ